MKKYIFYLNALVVICTTACRKIESDAQTIYIEVPGTGGGTTVGKRVELKGFIEKDTTLRAIDNNILTGKVYIRKGATLTIEKGATVKGTYTGSDVAALIVNRGAKIIAQGTADEPIVFTSASATPVSGDWGGIVICGKASNNGNANNVQGLYVPEGGIHNFTTGDGVSGSGDAEVPTPVDNDNSGILSYVRIEYAGYAYQPNQEINSLTMASVGSGTQIDHIQVTYAKDDAFEWFGGTVNCKYLIAYKTQDDDFDSDYGYSGSVQFGLIVRDSSIADVSKSEAFESDNNANGDNLTPQTRAVFCNITAFGPQATLNNIGNANYHGAAVQIRRNSSISIFNSVFAGWGMGISVENDKGTTDKNIQDGNLKLSGIVLAGCKKPLNLVTSAASVYTQATFETWFNDPVRKNTILNTVDEVRFTRPFDYLNPDWQPFGNSVVVIASDSNTYFDDPMIKARPFITKVDFLGAIAPNGADANWHKGWTRF